LHPINNNTGPGQPGPQNQIIMATPAQTKYIESLLKRIKRAGGTSYEKLEWLRNNYKELSFADASSWIDTLREMVRAHNEISARYSVNGRGKQI